ncbi:MAG: efflux RND transporter periplasmic adaptor subunit [Propionicimonas sp.]|nr:efflux RND transporter periplasmic adaptor subunit [Propionicimonas sp.]
MKRATLITGGVVLALALAGGGGFAYSAANSRTSVGVAEVVEEPLSVTVSASGTVDAARSAGVFPAVAGTLARLATEDGEAVAKGDVLAELDAAPLEAAATQAEAALAQAKASLTAARAQQALVDDKYSINLEKRAAREAVSAAQQGVAAAEQALRQARTNLAARTLTAPIAGTVELPSTTEAGMGVSPAAALLWVVDGTDLEFVAAVDESDIAAVQTARPASITLDSYAGSPFDGTVASVRSTPVSTATGGIAFPVRISFEPGDARVFLGMSGSADLETEAIPDAVTVPIEAVLTEGSQRYVFTVDDAGTAHKVAVAIGAETDTRAQVLDGVGVGERVATTGAATLSDGQVVEVAS